jgi:hypothetical protein
MSVWEAGQAAGLLLARVDGGILEDDETRPLAATVAAVLGPGRLDRLREVWQAAHTTADDDGPGMLALGRRWCEILDVPADQPPPAGPPSAGGTPAPSPLAEAVAATLAAVTATTQPEPAGPANATPPPGPVRPRRRCSTRPRRSARHGSG